MTENIPKKGGKEGSTKKWLNTRKVRLNEKMGSTSSDREDRLVLGGYLNHSVTASGQSQSRILTIDEAPSGESQLGYIVTLEWISGSDASSLWLTTSVWSLRGGRLVDMGHHAR